MPSSENILAIIFENTFVRAVIIPLALTIFTALVEYQLKIVSGKADGEYKYTAWVRQTEVDGIERIVSMPQQSLRTILDEYRWKLDKLVDIEQMFILRFSEFGTLALNLAIGALAVDIASLFQGTNNEGVVAGIIVAHIGMLVTIQLLLTQSLKTHPEKAMSKEWQSVVAIIIGFLAMGTAFFVI